MKAHQLIERFPSAARAVPPGEALVPQKIVQDSCFHRHPRGQQVIHLHRDERSQHAQLNANSNGSHQREAEETEARVRGHASLSSL
jgi:hypothetical protein